MRTTDANDFLYQFEASADYDPLLISRRFSAPFWRSIRPTIWSPPELGLMEDLIKRVPRGRFVLLPITDSTRGTWYAFVTGDLEAILAEFLTGSSIKRHTTW